MNNAECLKVIKTNFDRDLKDGLLNLHVKWLIDRADKAEHYERVFEEIFNILDGERVSPLVERLAFLLSESEIYQK